MDNRRSVLVTGVGGGVGQSILKSLHGSSYRVVAADGDNLGTGLFSAERAYRVPYASAPGYIERLIDICRSENCSLVFPGLDAELPVLARAREAFRAAGVTCVVSDPDVIETCDNKYLTAQFLARNGLPAPQTALLSDSREVANLGFPIVVKPLKGGHRSIGVHVVGDSAGLARLLAIVSPRQFVAQELVEGDEFTCGTVNHNGQCHGVIVMRRILRDGDTYKAFVVQDEAIERTVREAAEALRPFGACNFQLRVRDGRSFIFEINARCSGTTHARTLAGFNEPRMIADLLINGIKPHHQIRNVAILRYWKELVVEQSALDCMATNGQVEGTAGLL